MMFVIRSAGPLPAAPVVQIKMTRKTPEIVPGSAGKTDYFCVGAAEAMTALRDQGCEIGELRDGWYADDAGGGIGISGHGKFWEVRDTPFTVKEAVGPIDAPNGEAANGEHVNVRGAIFGV